MASLLLSPTTIGKLALKNRVVLAPLTRARAGPSRIPNDLMKTYYEQRANAGLLIAEATAISEQGYGWYGAPGIYTEEQAHAWKPAVDAVHAKGAKFFIQLWHMGRQGHPSFNPANEVVAPSAIPVGGDAHTRDATGARVPYVTPRALETSEIPALVQSYKESAKIAKLAGFDGVEIHGANGYLIDTFLQSSTNHRTDEYGGSMENRYRLLKEVIRSVFI
jgi:N-ethylmaleimide reductase